jgi:hypothetical protein
VLGTLRRLFFGLGVILGVVAPEVAPFLTARVFREGQEILANVEVEGAFGASAMELAEAGNRVAFELLVAVEGRGGHSEVRALRSIRFDALAGQWVLRLEPEGEEKRLVDEGAAVLLASRVWRLRLGPLARLEGGGSVAVSARPGIVDEAGAWHGAAILWGYTEPYRRVSYASPWELPY